MPSYRRPNTSAGYSIVRIALLLSSCTDPIGPPPPDATAHRSAPTHTEEPDSAVLTARLQHPPVPSEQISQYIRRIFQDRDGSLWFGTTSDGVVRYDPSAGLGSEGEVLSYFTPAKGFSSNWVSGIAQDGRGDLWFATGNGVSRYDGNRFTNYTTENGLADDQVWCVLPDRKGSVWVGTENGASRFDGKKFEPFPLPAADLSKFPHFQNPKQINSIIQDRSGDIWFATNGAGVFRYDGKTVTHISEKEGLSNNFVQTMMEDHAGNIWFGTRFGGLCEYHPSAALSTGEKSFTTFGRNELKGDDIWAVYQGSGNTIWISVARVGLCSYDGAAFTCYDERDGVGIRTVQCIFDDRSGQLWVGTSSGMYRWNGKTFSNWTKVDAQNGGQ